MAVVEYCPHHPGGRSNSAYWEMMEVSGAGLFRARVQVDLNARDEVNWARRYPYLLRTMQSGGGRTDAHLGGA